MDGLEDLKDHGNAAFKAGRYEEAVKAYTRALAAARGALHSGAPPTPPALPLQVATLYCNRAAACLKLERYEQAAHDAGRVLRLLLEPGASNARRCTAPWNSALVEKAWVRRGRALLGMGNFAAAMAELKRGARDDQALAAECDEPPDPLRPRRSAGHASDVGVGGAGARSVAHSGRRNAS